ncbi:alpha/beta hydrolase [Moraxella nasovis]|uniref:YheT family hydrolase n=1 Tax=Moraxella nasovis TaxID=2904121 RepID=UPI001F6105C8|nr:alpha/beta fold hydrolase [Moraxella nasovis]UNU74227.1 alpha/beta hydrolase [Moraxella nasovis]
MKNQSFRPPFWLKNPHLQTILPKFVVKYQPQYERELLKDSLGESDVAFDFLPVADEKDEQGRYKKPVVVLFHGMEGSSQSHYAKNLAEFIHAAGHHFVVAHFRSCGGVRVSGEVFYNAGDTKEVHHYLSMLQSCYQTIHAMGVSLGGNALAKYMGEYADKAIAKTAVVISAPVDLASSSVAMQRFIGRHIYTPYLLNPIIKKALENRLTDVEVTALKSAKYIGDFDNAFTAPRHGFCSKNDYYRQASSLPWLSQIVKPVLIITAKDDPFLGVIAEPTDVSKSVTLLNTKHGGHIGFLDFDHKKRRFRTDFIPKQALGFMGLLD